MRAVSIPLPELFLIAGTRVALGVGIGLLIAGSLSSEQRRAAGLACVLLGGLTTIPLAVDVISRSSARTSFSYDRPELAAHGRG